METHHNPVMVEEVCEALEVRDGGFYIDCTVGEGGHSQAILDKASNVSVMGIDLDMESLLIAKNRLQEHSSRTIFVNMNFTELDAIVKDHSVKYADGVLFDLGLSSLQVNRGIRGFSFNQEAHLDMRFDQKQDITAYQLVNYCSEDDLADILWRLGEEPRSRKIAHHIVKNRPIETTTELAKLVSRHVGKFTGRRVHPATRVFQAIRMMVNKELENIKRGVEHAINVLDSGGRIVIISYHSIEDRLVKSILKRAASTCVCDPLILQCVCNHTQRLKLINKRVITPDASEITFNPRSRSAKMRVAESI